MTRSETREYQCREHGRFRSTFDWETGDPWKQRCPRCNRYGRLYRPPMPRGAPFVQGDVRRPYYAPDKGRWITRKQDLRDFYRETGTYPMSDRDIRDALDAVAVADRQGQEDLKWYDREMEKEKECVFDEDVDLSL